MKRIITLICMFFFCFSYMNGSDWRSYETFYYHPVNEVVQAIYFEPGFVFFNNVLRFLDADFWVWFILLKCFLFLVFCYVLNELSKKDYFIILFVFLSQYGLFLFIDYPFRNVLAVSVFLMSLKYIYNRNFKFFFIFWLVGVSLHSSMFMMILFYYIVSIRLSKRKMVYAFIGINLFFMLGSNMLIQIFEVIGNYIPFLSGRIQNYFGQDSNEITGKVFSLGNTIKFFFFYLFIKYRDRLESDYNIYVVNFVFWFFILNRIALDISILGRLTLYFVVFYSLSLVRFTSYINKDFKNLFYCFLLSFSFLTAYTTITGSNKYVPYSHALYYYFYDNNKSFYQRSQYNLKNSPYTNRD